MHKFKKNPSKKSAPGSINPTFGDHTIVISVKTVRFSTSHVSISDQYCVGGADGISRVDFVAILALEF